MKPQHHINQEYFTLFNYVEYFSKPRFYNYYKSKRAEYCVVQVEGNTVYYKWVDTIDNISEGVLVPLSDRDIDADLESFKENCERNLIIYERFKTWCNLKKIKETTD